MKTMELKLPPLAWALSLALCMWATAVWLPSFAFHWAHSQALATLLASVGLATALSGIAAFRQATTTVNPLYPNRASSLVRSGPYRFTRNPMYLGMLLILFAWFLALQNFVSLSFVAGYQIIITELQIKPEERALEQIFGQEYRDYTDRVSRWWPNQLWPI